MPLTGTPKDLSDRSFNFASPLFNGVAAFYWGGSNRNLLVGREGTLFNPDGVANHAYVDAAIAGVDSGKAIVGTALKDSIHLTKPVNAATNDLPGSYNTFTIFWYGKVLEGQYASTLFNLTDENFNQFIRLGGYVDNNATDYNFTGNIKGATGQLDFSFPGGRRGEFHCYALRYDGETVELFRDGVSMGSSAGTPGTVTSDGTVLLGRREFYSWDSQLSRSELSLFVVYKNRALSNAEIATLNTAPFTILPAAGGSPSPSPSPSQWRKEARVYHIGNSVTDTIKYQWLKTISAANQVGYLYGRSMTPGAPLDWLLNNLPPSFTESPYGAFNVALPGYDWDVLTLQPFDRDLASDKASIQSFLNILYQRSSNANTRILLYSRWMRKTETAQNSGVYNDLDYPTLWNTVYTGTQNETKDYFQKLLLEVRTANAGKTIDIVPVGDAVLLFDTEAKTGLIPGFSSANNLYSDGIHFTDIGAYLVSCVFYASIFKETPVGLGFAPYTGVTQTIATKLQNIAWATVNGHPYSGVGGNSPTPTPNPSPSPSPTPSPTPTPNPTPSPSPTSTIINTQLSAYPGQSKIIQIFNIDGTPFIFPNKSTVVSRAVNRLRSVVCDLTPSITDAAKGMIRLSVPDNNQVRRNVNKVVLFDLIVTVDGLSKYIPIGLVDILYSPSLFSDEQTIPGGVAGGNTTNNQQQTPNNATEPEPIILYVQDQIWVDNMGKKVKVTIERQNDGKELFKLTEIT